MSILSTRRRNTRPCAPEPWATPGQRRVDGLSLLIVIKRFDNQALLKRPKIPIDALFFRVRESTKSRVMGWWRGGACAANGQCCLRKSNIRSMLHVISAEFVAKCTEHIATTLMYMYRYDTDVPVHVSVGSRSSIRMPELHIRSGSLNFWRHQPNRSVTSFFTKTL